MAFFTRAELKASGYILKKSVNKTASQILMNESAQFSLDKSNDIFLSHSYLDANKVLGLKSELEEMGYKVYVDWIDDKQLSREKMTKETAETFRIDKCSCLFFCYHREFC